MNNIVERLRGFKSAAAQAWSHEAADLIEQQAERIKGLEAERDAERDNCVAVIATYQAELAALRQRIADAPVVAHITEDGKVFNNGFVRDTDKPLISKEDLT